jgi:hypothetical protein
MAIRKYASLEQAQVLELKGSPTRLHTASLEKIAEFEDYRTEDGYLYARIRAISSRVNKNHDGWPSIELAGGEDVFNRHARLATANFTVTAAEGDSKYGFATFLGKPIFIDHNNSNPGRARGAIVDAKLHVEDHKTAAASDPYYHDAPDNHLPPTWVELLLEVDSSSFPKLAKAIVEGSKNPHKGIDGFSMGCDVEKSVCSICKQAATTPDEYCQHVKLKGAEFGTIDKHGKKVSKKAYEDCYGVKFFEISAVFDPADETALLREVRANVNKTAENPLPQSELMTVPEDVDSLRQEELCPVCGSDMEEGHQCEVCGYVAPPEGLDNPDLDKAQQPDPGGAQDAFADPMQPPPTQHGVGPPEQPSNLSPVAGVKNEMAWQIYHPRLGAVINSDEKPIKPGDTPATNEPRERIISDQDKPVTNRTAASMIAAVDKENTMRRTAADAPTQDTKADKRVDVEGVGGVIDATNEQASKPEGAHSWEEKGTTTDVTGIGGVLEDSNQEASKPSQGSDSLPTASREGEDAGFNKEKTTDDSGPTKTFDNGNEPESAVTNEVFAPWNAAKQGIKPAPTKGYTDVQPSDRVDVESDEFWNTEGTPTDQWTGTGGNGVTKQQDPVTPQVGPNNDVQKMTSFIDIVRIADTEVELGITEPEAKYDRMAELEQMSDEQIHATSAVLARVKTAGLRKNAATKQNGVGRVPSMKPQHTASAEEADEALFM